MHPADRLQERISAPLQHTLYPTHPFQLASSNTPSVNMPFLPNILLLSNPFLKQFRVKSRPKGETRVNITTTLTNPS